MGNVPKVVIMLPWNGINNDESKREQEKKTYSQNTIENWTTREWSVCVMGVRVFEVF